MTPPRIIDDVPRGESTFVGLHVTALILAGLATASLPAEKPPEANTSAEQVANTVEQQLPGVKLLCLQIDPNVATREELMLLPRIGPALADAIIAHRRQFSGALAFSSPEDLMDVHRIGPVTLEQVRPYLRLPRPDED